MRKVDIATNQGHLSFDENGTILLYSSTTAYDIAMISKNTRDNLVKLLNELEYKED